MAEYDFLVGSTQEIPSGQQGSILPARVANHGIRFILNLPARKFHIIHYTLTMVFNPFCCVAGNFFPNSARSHWSIRGHMTSNNETFPAKISERATLQNL